MNRYSFLFVLVILGLSAACTSTAATSVLTLNAQPTGVGPQKTVVASSVQPSANASATDTPQAANDAGPSGDIPDNATFILYQAPKYKLQYVEGWARELLPNDGVRFADKDSFVSVTLLPLPAEPVLKYALTKGAADSAQEFEQFVKTDVKAVTLPVGQAALLTFQGFSAADPVTGKRVTLDINRFYIVGANALAILTEATPSGVDNIDAFAQISQSFSWSGQ